MKQDKCFTLRFSLTAEVPPELLEQDDFEETEWLNDWEANIKPGLLRAVFTHLRKFDGWEAHVRNRGISPVDEIEVVVTRNYEPPKPLLQ
jgi:hypothetical protein